jgi:hypothetical protein
MVGDSVKTTFEGEEANGSHTSYTFTAKYDGKDYPITGTGSPNGADRIALKRVDANTVDATLTRAGKQVMITRRVVSSEGKVLTLMSKGTSPSGQSINAMTVWDKQ